MKLLRTVYLGILCVAVAAAQTPQLTATSPEPLTPLSIQQRVSLFRLIRRQPHGLELAARKYGHLVLEDGTTHCFNPPMEGLLRESTLVLTGSLVTLHSQMEGDHISTRCTIHPQEVLKGSAKHDVTFTILGGRVVFRNGSSLELRTEESTFVKVGARYLVLLTPESGGMYSLTNRIQPLFYLPPSGQIDACAAHSRDRFPVETYIGNDRADAVLARIRKEIASPTRQAGEAPAFDPLHLIVSLIRWLGFAQ